MNDIDFDDLERRLESFSQRQGDLSPGDAERELAGILSELFRGDGYKMTHTGGAGDRGIDYLAESSNGEKVVVQYKHYKTDRPIGFPNESGAILSNGRATHVELTGIAGDVKQPHEIREDALDALLRDDSFNFTDPWRKLVFKEFGNKVTLMFGTRRFTRQELIALSTSADTPKWIQQMAADNVARNWFKPEPTAANQTTTPLP